MSAAELADAQQVQGCCTGTAGAILRRFLDAAQTRGVLAEVTPTFDDDTDSAGRPWKATIAVAFHGPCDGDDLAESMQDVADVEVALDRSPGRLDARQGTAR